MTPRLTSDYAKNYCNRTLIVKVIVEKVVTYVFLWDTVYVKSHSFTEPVLLRLVDMYCSASHIYCMVLKLLVGPLLNCLVCLV